MAISYFDTHIVTTTLIYPSSQLVVILAGITDALSPPAQYRSIETQWVNAECSLYRLWSEHTAMHNVKPEKSIKNSIDNLNMPQST